MEAATLTPVARGCRPEATDDELVAATRAADDRAFELLYARYQRRITAYVLGMVRDHGRAEDVTQEVFVSALRRMRQTDRPIAFKPWIYEIAKNACIDQFRRSRRAEEVSFDAEEGVGPTLESSSPSPDAEVSSRIEFDTLRGAFVGLTDTHHRILVMRELEGRTYAEIGDRMGLTKPAVESTLFRARKRLAEEYDELVSGERCRRVQTLIAAAGHGRLGARDQRRMARHMSYCQPCRRAAARAGLGDQVPARIGVGAKVAGLLPLPAFLRERWLGIGSHHAAAAGDAAGGGGAGAFASWAHAAGPILDAGGGGWFKAVATAATVAVAGVGANVVTSSHHAPVDRAGDPGALAAAVSGGAANTPAAAVSAAPPPVARPASVAAGPARTKTTPAPKPRAQRSTRFKRDARRASRPAPATVAPATAGKTTTAAAPAPAPSGSGGSGGATTQRTGSTGAGSRGGSGSGSSSGGTVKRVAGDVERTVSGTVGGATGSSSTGSSGTGGLADALPSTPSVPTPSLPSTTLPSLGDTAVQVPTPTDVIETVDETLDQTVTGVTGVVDETTSGLDETTKALGDTATGLTGGLLGG